MLNLLRISAAALCLWMALPALASPLGPPVAKRTAGKHHHGRTIPARHNAGRPMHG